jgi:hypothetical protein
MSTGSRKDKPNSLRATIRTTDPVREIGNQDVIHRQCWVRIRGPIAKFFRENAKRSLSVPMLRASADSDGTDLCAHTIATLGSLRLLSAASPPPRQYRTDQLLGPEEVKDED